MRGPLVAVVPARAGSKRLPNKNRLRLGDWSLVERAVHTAKQVAGIERIIVDTDDPLIRDVALAAGAEVPYLRPRHLATDQISTAYVLLHLVDHMERRNECIPDALVLLQPTSPLRTPQDVQAAIATWALESARPVASVSEPLQAARDLVVESEPRVWSYLQDAGDSRRVMFENGAVYITPISYLKRYAEVFSPGRGQVVEIPALHGVDIDEAFQWKLAQALTESSWAGEFLEGE